jgi:hypothetical protein
MIVFYEKIFPQDLHSIKFFWLRFQINFKHFTKGSLTKNILDCKWFKRDSNISIVNEFLIFWRLECFHLLDFRRRNTFRSNLWSFRALILVSTRSIAVCPRVWQLFIVLSFKWRLVIAGQKQVRIRTCLLGGSWCRCNFRRPLKEPDCLINCKILHANVHLNIV